MSSDPVDPQTSRYLIEGRGIKADLLLVSRDGRLVVVKDYGKRGWLGRMLGRFHVAREARIYRILQDVRGVPSFLGSRDRESFTVAHVPGRPIDQYQHHKQEVVEKILGELERLIDEIHRKGITHLDLRRRDNILVDENGQVHIIDFAGSLHFRPGSLGDWWLFPLLKKIDESAFLKWKQRLAPASMSRKELSRLRRISLLRRLWFFN